MKTILLLFQEWIWKSSPLHAFLSQAFSYLREYFLEQPAGEISCSIFSYNSCFTKFSS